MTKLTLLISIALMCATFSLLYFAPSKAQNVSGQGLQESFATNGSQALFGAQFPFGFVQTMSLLQLQPTPFPTTRISSDQGKYIIVETPSGKTVQGHSYEKPPPQPRAKDEEGDERRQPSAPLIDDGLTILPDQVKETECRWYPPTSSTWHVYDFSE